MVLLAFVSKGHGSRTAAARWLDASFREDSVFSSSAPPRVPSGLIRVNPISHQMGFGGMGAGIHCLQVAPFRACQGAEADELIPRRDSRDARLILQLGWEVGGGCLRRRWCPVENVGRESGTQDRNPLSARPFPVGADRTRFPFWSLVLLCRFYNGKGDYLKSPRSGMNREHRQAIYLLISKIHTFFRLDQHQKKCGKASGR